VSFGDLNIQDSSKFLASFGHAKLTSCLSHQYLDSIYFELNQIVKKNRSNSSPSVGKLEENVNSYGEGWIFSENLWRYSPRLLRYLVRGPLAEIAKLLFMSLFGSANHLSLLRDQTYFKNPGSESTPWHQDGTFLPLPSLKSLTFWIPFMNIDSTLSPMHYIDSSHKSCWLGNISTQNDCHVDNFDSLYKYFLNESFGITVYDNVCKGDVLVHDSWTMHGSPPHIGSEPRLAMVVVYYLADGSVSICPSLRMINESNTSQARSLRSLNEKLLFPGMNGLDLSGFNSKTPAVRC